MKKNFKYINLIKGVKLTEKKKALIKRDFEHIDAAKLSPEIRSYYNKVKAGKARAKQAARFPDGSYITKKFEDEKGLKELAGRRGYKSVKELVKKEPIINQIIEDFFKNEATLQSYRATDLIDLLNTYGGKVFLNDEKTTVVKAIAEIKKLESKFRRDYNAHEVIFQIKYKKAGKEMYIYTAYDADEIAADEMQDGLIDVSDSIKIIVSSKKKKSSKKRGK